MTPATPAQEPPRVTVRGEARLDVDPETAGLDITVLARGADRRAALADLTRRNGGVLDLLRSYGEAIERTETGAFTLTPELARHGRGEKVRAYQGRVLIRAVVADFTALGELTSRLADLDLTRVDGPRWALRPDSPVHREARMQAVHDAVTRAREYAEALGAELVSLLDLADQGTEALAHTAFPVSATRGGYGYGAAAAAESDPPALDLEPRRQTVHAHVTARFTMTAPIFGPAA
ncbi:SIMPL domain-containing protein [Streptomyces sp. URMC 129]|uniref:SIMPL domain-containing protein n=1 Tax=Streptomyces sp. URMC 129 TaxID=3423407 RepID=UPI003F1E04C1